MAVENTIGLIKRFIADEMSFCLLLCLSVSLIIRPQLWQGIVRASELILSDNYFCSLGSFHDNIIGSLIL